MPGQFLAVGEVLDDPGDAVTAADTRPSIQNRLRRFEGGTSLQSIVFGQHTIWDFQKVECHHSRLEHQR
jgi:hypothetical protein